LSAICWPASSRASEPSRKPFSASHQIEPADREADEAVDRRAARSQLVDLLVARAAAEQHADDALAALALARLLAEHLASELLVDALDLPDVDLEAEVLAVRDRAAHELGRSSAS
jgi:hypothetical protein